MINLTTHRSSIDLSHVADLILDDLPQIESVVWEVPKKFSPPSKQSDIRPTKVPPVLKLVEIRVPDLIEGRPAMPNLVAPKLNDLTVVQESNKTPVDDPITKTTNKVYTQVEQMPAFLECALLPDEQSRITFTQERLLTYIYNNLK